MAYLLLRDQPSSPERWSLGGARLAGSALFSKEHRLTLAYANPQRYARSAELFAEACEFVPGGVNSTAAGACE